MKNLLLSIIFILVIIILLYIQNLLENTELFNSPSAIDFEDYFIPIPPIINKIKKKKDNILVEWQNDYPDKIKKFIIIYRNSSKEGSQPEKLSFIVTLGLTQVRKPLN